MTAPVWERDYRTGGNCTAHRAVVEPIEYLVTNGDGRAPATDDEPCTLHVMLTSDGEPFYECDFTSFALAQDRVTRVVAMRITNGGAS